VNERITESESRTLIDPTQIRFQTNEQLPASQPAVSQSLNKIHSRQEGLLIVPYSSPSYKQTNNQRKQNKTIILFIYYAGDERNLLVDPKQPREQSSLSFSTHNFRSSSSQSKSIKLGANLSE
jgi:hypothetical protein